MPDTLRIVDGKLFIVDGALNVWDGTGDPCCCDCLGCEQGTLPAQVLVTIPATWVTQGHPWTPDCDDPECDLFEGDFVLDFVPRPDGVCEWSFAGTPSDCLVVWGFVLRTQKVSPGNYLISLVLSGLYFADRPPINGGPGNRIFSITWRITGLPDPIVCNSFVDYALPYISAISNFDTAGGLEEGCDFPGEEDALLNNI